MHTHKPAVAEIGGDNVVKRWLKQMLSGAHALPLLTNGDEAGRITTTRKRAEKREETDAPYRPSEPMTLSYVSGGNDVMIAVASVLPLVSFLQMSALTLSFCA